jgi:DNA-directed RNA polymerase specialized sigma24 family protein
MMALDRAVFAAAQAGDPLALERLLRALQPDIRRYARRQCHRSSVVDDVVQEALIVIYRRVGNVRDGAALAAWVCRIVARLCMLPALVLMGRTEAFTYRHEAEHFARMPQDELRIDLVRALESLPVIYREVILLRDMEQMTITEVAARLVITREAAKSRIHRARALVREYLQPDTGNKGGAA